MPMEINEIDVPGSPGSPAWTTYVQHLEVRNRNEADVLGAAAPYVDPLESLSYFQDQERTRKRLFVARLDGEIVGQALFEHAKDEEDSVGWVFGGVLAASRRYGVGTALFDHVENVALAANCNTLQSFVLHATIDGESRVPARSGFGSLPAGDAGVRFVTQRGYELQQVERWNTLDVPADPGSLRAARDEAAAAAGSAYRLHTWAGPSPERWLDDLAALATWMERDAPHEGFEVGGTPVDADRVRAEEGQEMSGGRRLLTAAVEHIPSGRLAGYSRLSLPGDPTRPVTQGVTIVVREHRGHRLGMLIKAANLLQLEEESPAAKLILTGNAEQNVHILDINYRLGFRTAGYTGAWKKTLVGQDEA